MLYIAMMFRYIRVMAMVLVVCIISIIALTVSIMNEESHGVNRIVRSMKILNNISDASVIICGFYLIPGTDYMYVPRYGYYKDGILHKTFSYMKCKMMSS